MVPGTPRWSNTASTKFRAAGPTRAHRSISQLLRRMSVRSAASALDVRSLFEQMDVIRADVCNQDAAAAEHGLPQSAPPAAGPLSGGRLNSRSRAETVGCSRWRAAGMFHEDCLVSSSFGDTKHVELPALLTQFRKCSVVIVANFIAGIGVVAHRDLAIDHGQLRGDRPK